MPTVGRTTTTGNTNSQSNTGSNNQYGTQITMPETGLIKTLHVYVSGNGGTITGALVLWDYPSGNVLAQTASITFSSGSTAVNGQAWQVADLITPYLATSGKNMYIGFWRNSSQTANFSYINSSGVIRPQTNVAHANVASVSALSVADGTTGTMSAYADYVKGGLGFYTGTVWNKYALNRWNGTAWQRHPLKRWSGSTWEWYA